MAGSYERLDKTGLAHVWAKIVALVQTLALTSSYDAQTGEVTIFADTLQDVENTEY